MIRLIEGVCRRHRIHVKFPARKDHDISKTRSRLPHSFKFSLWCQLGDVEQCCPLLIKSTILQTVVVSVAPKQSTQMHLPLNKNVWAICHRLAIISVENGVHHVVKSQGRFRLQGFTNRKPTNDFLICLNTKFFYLIMAPNLLCIKFGVRSCRVLVQCYGCC